MIVCDGALNARAEPSDHIDVSLLLCSGLSLPLPLQVSALIERFAEGSAEREAPLHALKKALQLVATDCHASYAR